MKDTKREIIDLTEPEPVKNKEVINLEDSSLSSTDTEDTQWDTIIKRNNKKLKTEIHTEANCDGSVLSDSSDSFIEDSEEKPIENLAILGRNYRANRSTLPDLNNPDSEVVFVKVVKAKIKKEIGIATV